MVHVQRTTADKGMEIEQRGWRGTRRGGRVFSRASFSFSDALLMILDTGAEEVLEPIVIALRAAEDETILAKASPEHRMFAEEFLAKVGLKN